LHVIAQPEPDTKDWTWVLERECPECGFDSRVPAREELADLTLRLGQLWVDVMTGRPEAEVRPEPTVWSPLEYACHVRDVFDLASTRVRLMLSEDGPHYANWDQDATAIEDDYAAQDPETVTVELGVAARGFAEVVASVPDDAWERTGFRGDGATFTIDSFTRYLLHDAVHHLTDVTGERWA
jgi:hypothetical protein